LALFKEGRINLIKISFKKVELVVKDKLEVVSYNQGSLRRLMVIQLTLPMMIVLREKARLAEGC